MCKINREVCLLLLGYLALVLLAVGVPDLNVNQEGNLEQTITEVMGCGPR